MDRFNRSPFFQGQTDSILDQWENFKENFEDEEGEDALVEWEIDGVWDIWMDRVEIDRTKIDCYNPNILPGFEDNFAIFKDFCRLRDPAFYADHRNEEYIDWLKEHPEAFFTMYYQYLDRPPETRTNYRNGKPAMQDVVFMINNRDARIYIHALQACKHDLVELSGSSQKLKNEFSSVVPEDWYAARTTRLINAYGGFDWVDNAKTGTGQYAEMQKHLPTFEKLRFPIEVKVPSRAVVGDAAECLDCGAWSNRVLNEVVKKEEADVITKNAKTEEEKKTIITLLMSERAEKKLKVARKETELNKKKRSTQKRERFIEKLEKIERAKENREKRALNAFNYLLLMPIEDIKTDEDVFDQIQMKAWSKPGIKKIRDSIKTVLNCWDYLSESVVEKLKQLLQQYEAGLQN